MQSQYNTWLTQKLGIDYPIILAPMFLVSNTRMIIAALESGITAAFPALNYRTEQELINAIREIKQKSTKPFGVNLIVNKSNPKAKAQLDICLQEHVAFIITSLGNPKEVIEQCHQKNILVFCDVTDVHFAKKVEQMGADAVIAVNNQAGGHCGNHSALDLISSLKKNITIPVISAGGVSTNEKLKQHLTIGADGLSIGTIFIASHEADVTEEYKQAIVNYGAKDIVLTEKLSGTPLTVINTDYVQKTGTKASWLERVLLKNKWLKKIVKTLIFYRGMKQIEKATFSHTYKTVWCAGPSIEDVHEVRSVKEIVGALVD
jgi:nitronate monooxygenase